MFHIISKKTEHSSSTLFLRCRKPWSCHFFTLRQKGALGLRHTLHISEHLTAAVSKYHDLPFPTTTSFASPNLFHKNPITGRTTSPIQLSFPCCMWIYDGLGAPKATRSTLLSPMSALLPRTLKFLGQPHVPDLRDHTQVSSTGAGVREGYMQERGNRTGRAGTLVHFWEDIRHSFAVKQHPDAGGFGLSRNKKDSVWLLCTGELGWAQDNKHNYNLGLNWTIVLEIGHLL